MKKMFKKNDTVIAIAGKNRGKKGRVLAVYPLTGRILVEGMSFVKKAVRPSQRNPQGGTLQIESAFDISNVMHFCNRCQARTRVGRRALGDGTRERFCRKCQEVI